MLNARENRISEKGISNGEECNLLKHRGWLDHSKCKGWPFSVGLILILLLQPVTIKNVDLESNIASNSVPPHTGSVSMNTLCFPHL